MFIVGSGAYIATKFETDQNLEKISLLDHEFGFGHQIGQGLQGQRNVTRIQLN